jgi:hypothetical protein
MCYLLNFCGKFLDAVSYEKGPKTNTDSFQIQHVAKRGNGPRSEFF